MRGCDPDTKRIGPDNPRMCGNTTIKVYLLSYLKDSTKSKICSWMGLPIQESSILKKSFDAYRVELPSLQRFYSYVLCK